MHTISPLAKSMVTVFGLGSLRPAPGTWGSLPPVAIGLALLLAGAGRGVFDLVMIVMLVVFSGACVVFGTAAEAHWRRKDPGHIVADETAGMCVTLFLIPQALLISPLSAAMTLVGAFLLFRGFDILKPWPAGALQAVRGGWGVLLDDLIAGAMAAALIWIVHIVQ